ncbi:MAG: radical SAM family heme chaperone HemW [Oscillospiraceae bacterium]|jgi:oxygen-independent coproporphyrinogen-3 oxidase|nr:radical SAM family heme chaperone HemW [Oscillospiraceae bacterium]
MEKSLGIYIHIPFCRSRCLYCDFYSTTGRESDMARYESALRRHIREYSPQLDGYVIDTVYFGGGTPSCFGAKRLIAVLDELKRRGHVSIDAEVTLEANPESVNKNDFARLARAGFNRVSLGVQAGSDKALRDLGRVHSFHDAETAVATARAAGFRNVGVDMMYGLPGQSGDDWSNSLMAAVALAPDHLSCYGLKIEEGTPFYIFRDSPFLPDDDKQADMYLYAVDALSRFGYRQYEVSNFARRGRESRHNLKYWTGGDYIGFGASAHSYIGSVRYASFSDIDKYMEGVESGGGVVETSEEISGFDLASEYLMLRLRTALGVSEEEYYSIYKCGMTRVLELLQSYSERGWATFRDGRWRLTPEGFLLSNTLIGEVLDAQTRERTETISPWQASPTSDDTQTTLFGRERRISGSVF